MSLGKSYSLLIATQNQGKLREFEELMSPRIRLLNAKKIFNHVPQVRESGKTYYENALMKALRVFDAFKVPILADDSGLECEALRGKPGVLTARFGGSNLTWPNRWKLLNDSIKHSSHPRNRRCHFRAVLCYYDGKNVPQYFEGVIHGLVTKTPIGDKGFGYDPIFYVPSMRKTLAELDPKIKNKISHRARAVKAFLDHLT